MAGAQWAVDRLVEDVGRLGARGLPREEYFAEVTARLRRVFLSAAACWHTVAVAVPTTSGWLTLHASLPDGGTAGRVAIVVELSASAASTAVRLEAYGVTAREPEVAVLLAAGLTNPEIAERLVLSPYTVQDHIKSLLEKTNVCSRQELVARIFLEDYLPRIDARAPLESTGQFTHA